MIYIFPRYYACKIKSILNHNRSIPSFMKDTIVYETIITFMESEKQVVSNHTSARLYRTTKQIESQGDGRKSSHNREHALASSLEYY